MDNGRRQRPEERRPSRPHAGKKQSTRKVDGRTVWSVIGTLVLVGILTTAMIAGLFMTYVKTTLAPDLEVDASEYTLALSSIIYYQDKESGEWVELQKLHGLENRVWVDYDQIPQALIDATVSIEDERFYTHHGVDWKRTAGAAVKMFTGMNKSYGGSTITQQLLKNMTNDKESTVKRKVTEIFRALEFEKKYTKPEILELYLNTITFGQGCNGVQTAAQIYFGKDVSELDLAECAAIIGITNNPSLYGPFSTVKVTNTETGVVKTARELNKSRQELILGKMLELGKITQEEHDAAKAEELQFTDGSVTAEDLAAAAAAETEDASSAKQSFFVDQVRRDVVNDMVEQLGITKEMAEDKLLYGGYNIYTTLDPDVQAIAESVYEDRSNLDVTSKRGQQLRSGITIVDVTNGNVVAMVGDVGPKTADMVWNYATGVRQCGSSIKPLSVYAPALDANAITPASTFDNYPVRLLNDNPWPKNSPNKYTGWTTLETGIYNSINTVAVQVVEKLGVSNSFQFMTENLNISTLVSPEMNAAQNDVNLSSMGLGGLTRGVTTEEMAAAYASFANEGIYNSPRLYVEVTDSNGKTVLNNETETHAAMKETTAYFMNQMLQKVITQGTGTSAKFSGMTIAGKTGTTNDNYDRYFVGYTPYYSAAVWCGYDQPEKVVYSGNPSITMWKKVMQKIHENLENKSFSAPSSGLSSVEVCMDSGLLASEACYLDARGSRVRTVSVATGTAPTDTCAMHVMKEYCTEGKCLAGPSCPEESVKVCALLDYTRVDYGPDIVAEDDGYLISKLETIKVCPVHGLGAGWEYDENGNLVYDPAKDPNASVPDPGETEPENPGETPTEPSTPTPPTTPEEDPTGGFGDANWWNNLWG